MRALEESVSGVGGVRHVEWGDGDTAVADAAAADAEQARRRRKRIITWVVVIVVAVVVVVIAYWLTHRDVSANCVGDDDVIVEDANCATPLAAGSPRYYGGYPVYIGSSGRYYHYVYGGGGSRGQRVSGGTTTVPRSSTRVVTPSGRRLSGTDDTADSVGSTSSRVDSSGSKSRSSRSSGTRSGGSRSSRSHGHH